MENFTNFYPTPEDLLRDITRGKKFGPMDAILEPSAGKGNIVDFIKENVFSGTVDCIEINPELRAALKGKEYPVVAEDFLQFTPSYHYDLIIMNPPFDQGTTHLLKALDIQSKGGRVICILNAETIRNPYSNERKVLVDKLDKLEASIEYRECAFTSAERSTNVEIAVIDVTVPTEESRSFIFENLKQRFVKDEKEKDITDVVTDDYISVAVLRYNMEVEAGITLIREYKALKPYIMEDVQSTAYTKPVLRLTVGDKDNLSESKYVKKIRMKYWNAMFQDPRFTKAMPNDMRENYRDQVRKLADYEFNIINIKELQIQMCGSLIEGIEDTIMKLFDEMSYVSSWSSEYDSNIHYYNGWATNKSWYVNKKVILPLKAYNDIWKRMEVSNYRITEKFADIEKAFNYLDGCPGTDLWTPGLLSRADKEGVTKDISCKYFNLTFYKKGTVHIVFKDMDLLKKLNIFGGKGKNMLPPRYGKVNFDDMTEKEKSVVKEFDGSAEEYMKVYNNQEKFLIQTSELLQLPEIA